VHCSLEGEASVIDEMIKQLQETKPLNSKNATVEELHFYVHLLHYPTTK